MARPCVNYSPRELEQDYKFTMILYPDSTDYDINIVFNCLDSFCSQWYYIKHDKDTICSSDIDELEENNIEYSLKIGQPKKVHYHVVMLKENPVKLGLIAKQLQVPSNYIQRIKKLNGAIEYLVHANNPDKHQYSRDEIICKDGCSVNKFFAKMDVIYKAEQILDYCMNNNTNDKLSLISWAISSGTYSELVRSYPLWRDVMYQTQHLR